MIDTLIRNGRIVDGTGNPWFYGDLALSNGRIERIAPPESIDPASARDVVDATGQVISPGFIDIQSHSILTLLLDGRSLSKVSQGITTEIMGEMWTPAPFGGKIASPFGNALVHRLQDVELATWDPIGRTWERFGDWLLDLEQRGTSTNIGSFLGGGTVREYAMGESIGQASPDALTEMRRVTAESMEDGAFGVATALIYPPNVFSDTNELIEVMKVVRAHHGMHITHMRSEGVRILEGLDETLRIAEESGVNTEIYHLKASGEAAWRHMPTVIERITAARARGIQISANMYPYDASGTGLSSIVPPWADEDGKLFDNLNDPDAWQRILDDMRDPDSAWGHDRGAERADKIILAEFRNPELQQRFQGRVLADVADELGMPWDEAALYLLREDNSSIFSMFRGMSEENMKLQFQQEWIAWATDAGGVDPKWMSPRGLVHPRAYGTFPRAIGHYGRDRGWVSLEDAVRKSTWAVASRLGMTDRGLLVEGMRADIVVFDADRIIDRATYTDPHQLSDGVDHVWVNGTPVLRSGEHTGDKPGARVHGPGYRHH